MAAEQHVREELEVVGRLHLDVVERARHGSTVEHGVKADLGRPGLRQGGGQALKARRRRQLEPRPDGTVTVEGGDRTDPVGSPPARARRRD